MSVAIGVTLTVADVRRWRGTKKYERGTSFWRSFFREKELNFIKISAGQMGADMMTKHASVGVVRYNKKLIGMM